MLPALLALVAAGGYVQVAGQDIFWCGRTEAFPGTTVLAVLGLGQTALYLASAARERWQAPYRLSQWATLPVLAIAIVPVLRPHPGTVVFLASLAAAVAGFGWRRGGLFAVVLLGIFAAIGQIPFALHGVIVRDWMVWAALAAAAGTAVWVARSVKPVSSAIIDLVPLTLLLFPLLRARFPDIAYDSLSYKVTVPYQMAEWRTGDSAIIDGYMIGTNLQEMLNALLRIVTGDWRPQLMSSLSFVLLALVVPSAFPTERFPPGARRAAIAFAGVMAFVLTEAGIAQGTAYQEPLLLLFLVAALVRCPLWPGFIGMAAAVKITALFIAPLILLYHARRYRDFRRSPRFLAIGVLAGVLALGPQLGRNLVFSGRILGMSEMLATVTDPPGPHRIMAVGIDRYDVRPRGGLVNNAIQSACNIWLLDAACSVRYKGNFEAGFSVFPASRAALLAAIFAVAACLRRRNPVACPGHDGAARSSRLRGLFDRAVQICGGSGFGHRALTLAAFGVGYAGLLAIVSEGRYFLPLSLGFAILLLIEVKWAATFARRPWALVLGCWLVGADLLPGTFTNASWICRRDITAAVDNPSLRGPRTPVQAFLATLTERYKQQCAPPGLPPVILAETDRMNGPYLGTQRIFHVFSQRMISGFLAADLTRQARMGDAVLAVVVEHPAYAASVLGPALADYRACYEADGMQVLCSNRLAPARRACAASLY
ncbi:MAG TPA: hypothetical protein VHB27_04770 [Rhodopila sp.]|uniref:hypothetical protein n=1 Tax=Rhodopila sp. TaxID=2480087 RepID=UPI002CA3D2C0|nr:hypothetical protein [Rhodopila sp.]HVY14516.1 hypothetical protein [Rhodopila sp.]